MSDKEPKGLYVYQPFGMQNRGHWTAGSIYGVGGLEWATIHGLTKSQAEAVLKALQDLEEAP